MSTEGENMSGFIPDGVSDQVVPDNRTYPECCGGTCRRSKPLLIAKGGLSGRWYVATRWREVRAATDDRPPLIDMQEKHDVTEQLVHRLIEAGWTPPADETKGATGGG